VHTIYNLRFLLVPFRKWHCGFSRKCVLFPYRPYTTIRILLTTFLPWMKRSYTFAPLPWVAQLVSRLLLPCRFLCRLSNSKHTLIPNACKRTTTNRNGVKHTRVFKFCLKYTLLSRVFMSFRFREIKTNRKERNVCIRERKQNRGIRVK
jgi:hypothetical protein